MKASNGFSLSRWWSMVLKEFLQLRRDRLTFAMIVGIPIAQLVLFGFAINNDPRHLPTAIISADHSEFTRSFITAMKSSDYFDIVGDLPDEESGRVALARGKVQFVVNIPANFTQRLLRGERPALLIEADATDPGATGMALAAVGQFARAVGRDERGIRRMMGGADPGDTFARWLAAVESITSDGARTKIVYRHT